MWTTAPASRGADRWDAEWFLPGGAAERSLLWTMERIAAMNGPPAIVISKGAQGLAVTRGLGERGVRVIVLHWTDHDVARLSRYASEAVPSAASRA